MFWFMTRVCCFFVAVGMRLVFGFVPVFVIALGAGVLLAVVCFCTSRNETKPGYHDVSVKAFSHAAPAV